MSTTDTKKDKGALAKAQPTGLSKGTARSLTSRVVDNTAAELAAQLGLTIKATPAPEDFESVRSNQGLYRPEDCTLGTDANGQTVYCPIWGYPVGAAQRTDPTNGPYVQIQIHLTSDCIAVKGPERERVIMKAGECIMVTMTSALDELLSIAGDMTKSVEVCLTPLGKLPIKGGHTFWDWDFKKSRSSIPRVHAPAVEDPDEFPPSNGALPEKSAQAAS